MDGRGLPSIGLLSLVGDHLAELGYFLFDPVDSFGPGALAGMVGIGKARGVLLLCFSKGLEGVVKSLLESWARHNGFP